jgi:broad specificity phosphatase PhoE
MASYILARAARVNPDDVVLYIARHGETEFNEDNLFRGAANPKLNKDGIKDAHDLANFFMAKKIGRLISSKMDRAAETANIIGKRIHKTPEFTDKLDSWNTGVVSGMPEESEAEKLIDYYQGHPDETIPDGESLNHFHSRVAPMFYKSIEDFKKSSLPDLYTAHHSIIKEAAAIFNGNFESALVDPGGVIALVQRPSGFRVIPIFKPEIGDDSE